MKYLLLICALLVIAGCSYQNYKKLTVNGKEINTPYGRADADMYYESKLCFPKCAEVIINAVK